MTTGTGRQCLSVAGQRSRGTCRRFFSVKTRLSSHAHSESQPKDQDRKEPPGLRPSQLLPQSPFITHPRPGADKKRKRRPLPEELDALQKNPWAVALASPVRMCSVTGTRLPRAFLSDYELVRRKNSNKLWFLPANLLKDELRPPHSTTRIAHDEDTTDARVTEPDGDSSSPIPKGRSRTVKIVTRLPLLRKVTEFFAFSNAKKKPPISRIVPTRWKYPMGPITRDLEGKMVWREDMADFMLRAMRRDAVKKLESVCSQYDGASTTRDAALLPLAVDEYSEQGISHACSALTDSDRLSCGAVLVVDFPQQEASSTGNDRPSDNILKSRLPALVTLHQDESKVPIFDLTVLLGEDDLAKVKQYLPQPDLNAFFLRPQDAVGVEAILSLWKLRNFIREDAS